MLSLLDSVTGRDPLMVAIDGLSGAGKSTLAADLVEALPDVELIRGDDFYRAMDEEQRFGLSPVRAYHEDYDWQRLLQEALAPLRAGTATRFRRYDWSTGELGGWVEARPAPVVIVEGVCVLRPELVSMFDVTIWVETSPEVRASRLSRRGDPAEEVDRWDRIERFYVSRFRPAASADLVVMGEPT